MKKLIKTNTYKEIDFKGSNLPCNGTCFKDVQSYTFRKKNDSGANEVLCERFLKYIREADYSHSELSPKFWVWDR